MSPTILTIIGLVVSILGITVRIVFWRSGRDKERLKRAEKTIDDIAKGNAAASDSSYDDELRERYGK